MATAQHATGGLSWSELTVRERGVAALVVRGCPDKEIAARLRISYPTVRTHLQRIYAKLGVTNRIGLMRAARRDFLRRRRRSQGSPTL